MKIKKVMMERSDSFMYKKEVTPKTDSISVTESSSTMSDASSKAPGFLPSSHSSSSGSFDPQANQEKLSRKTRSVEGRVIRGTKG